MIGGRADCKSSAALLPDLSDDSAVRTCKVFLAAFASPNSFSVTARRAAISIACFSFVSAHIEALP